MQKNILITGSTDGIGFEAARLLVKQGHRVLLHGRNPDKLDGVVTTLSGLAGDDHVESYVADLSSLPEVSAFAKAVTKRHSQLDVLINNAGIFHTSQPVTKSGLDIRFIVNTIAPYLLTQRLLPLLGDSSRVINLSSAAQSPVNLEALSGRHRLTDDFTAYAQSKLALTMWSVSLAHTLKAVGPAIIAVNPGSMLGTKMVKQGFGVEGKDIRIGADIILRAALADDFASATGRYYDNDSGQFASPHPDALNPQKSSAVVSVIESLLEAA